MPMLSKRCEEATSQMRFSHRTAVNGNCWKETTILKNFSHRMSLSSKKECRREFSPMQKLSVKRIPIAGWRKREQATYSQDYAPDIWRRDFLCGTRQRKPAKRETQPRNFSPRKREGITFLQAIFCRN